MSTAAWYVLAGLVSTAFGIMFALVYVTATRRKGPRR